MRAVVAVKSVKSVESVELVESVESVESVVFESQEQVRFPIFWFKTVFSN